MPLVENSKRLFQLYIQPLAALSRLLDEGRLWIALLLAVATTFALHVPSMAVVTSPVAVAPDPESAPPPRSGIDRRAIPEEPLGPGILERSLERFTAYDAFSPFAPLIALALFVTPGIILWMSVVKGGGFTTVLTRDYLPLLLLLAMAWTAAFLPLTLFGLGTMAVHIPMPRQPILWWVSTAYFLALAGCAARVMYGVRLGEAAAASIMGGVAGIAGVMVRDLAGPLLYYAGSPLFLYFIYSLFQGDIRALGSGLSQRQNFRRQLELATINPRDSDAHYQLGLIYQQRRRVDEASASFHRAVEINDEEIDAQHQLGRIAIERGNPTEAIARFRKVAALDERHASGEVWRELGAALFTAGENGPALVALEKYTNRRPYDPEGLCWYGRVLAQQEKTTEAREAFERAIEAVDTMPSNRRREVSRWKSVAKDELAKLK